MPRNSYSPVASVTAGDNFAVWRPGAGNWYTAPLSTMLAYFTAQITPGVHVTQYSAPSATGFTVTLTAAATSNIWLILTPVAGYAAGTITLPAPGYSFDKQEISINCTQAVTALTIDGNGATAVTGEPSGLSANDFFTLRYDAVTSTWYRVA
jgi:hypothetical protein